MQQGIIHRLSHTTITEEDATEHLNALVYLNCLLVCFASNNDDNGHNENSTDTHTHTHMRDKQSRCVARYGDLVPRIILLSSKCSIWSNNKLFSLSLSLYVFRFSMFCLFLFVFKTRFCYFNEIAICFRSSKTNFSLIIERFCRVTCFMFAQTKAKISWILSLKNVCFKDVSLWTKMSLSLLLLLPLFVVSNSNEIENVFSQDK